VAKQPRFQTINGWGGSRRGAGRPNVTGGVNHMARAEVSAKWPVHVNLNLRKGLPSLRRKTLLKAFGPALLRVKKFGLNVNHFTILHNHIHFIVEAKSNAQMAKGMQSLAISLAKTIKRIARTERHEIIDGPVFVGRYHLHVLKTPTEMRRALKYVLMNETKHDGRAPALSVFSSGFLFGKWDAFQKKFPIKEAASRREFWNEIVPLEKALAPPKSWLGSVGWTRAAG
jgi:REP element-mobilizing transposase RayT